MKVIVPEVSPEQAAAILTEKTSRPLAYVVPLECYFARKPDGSWNLSPLSQKGAENALIARGLLEPRSEWHVFDHRHGPLGSTPDVERLCVPVAGVEVEPNAPSVFVRDGAFLLNTWTPPRLVPAPGEYPRVRRVLDWLAAHDAGAVDWLENWIAFKVQHPERQPGTAVLLSGRPGNGKNTLFRILALILGESNAAQIGEEDLSRPFNAHFSGKLLILANELVEDHKRAASLGDGVKSLITDRRLWIESKGIGRIETTNRLAVLAATNKTKVIALDEGDRKSSPPPVVT